MRISRLLLLLRALIVAALVASFVAVPSVAVAEGSPGAAEFKKGRQLYKKGAYDEALEQFRAALEASGSPNARLYVARALREVGDITESYREMKETLDDARERAESDPKYVKTRDSAAAELALLEPQVAKLVVAVAGADGAVELTVDGKPAAVGKPIVLEPGDRMVVARAPGMVAAEQQVTVIGGETKTATLTLVAATGDEPPTDGEPAPGQPDQPEPDEPSGGAVRIAGFVVAGVGVASMVVFAITAAQAKSDFDTLNEECGGVRCTDPSYADTVDSGETMELVSHVTLGIGLAGIVAGSLMIIFGGPDEPAESTAGFAPLPGGGLLTWGGRF
ncbi:MAG: hypothetical protein JRI23_07740 [Deltaproteobacteria bacterium]|jgi:hypothetical protein|nr:hypothetical protein [Deltaproteobacteria bacterium]MBW2531497.1 hypothetical protein [Deltaproteobacteria bacterium]